MAIKIKKVNLSLAILTISLLLVGIFIYFYTDKSKISTQDLKCTVLTRQLGNIDCGLIAESSKGDVYYIAGKVSSLRKSGDRYTFDLMTLNSKMERVSIPIVLPTENLKIHVMEVVKMSAAIEKLEGNERYKIPQMSSLELFGRLKPEQDVTIQIPTPSDEKINQAKQFIKDEYFYTCTPLNKIEVYKIKNSKDINFFQNIYYKYIKKCGVMIPAISI